VSRPRVAPEPVRLHPDDLAALADLVAERVAARLLSAPEAMPPGVPPAAALGGPERLPAQPPALLTAADVARRFGVSAEWVRENADHLGVVRIGNGPRPRLRFSEETVAAALTARSVGGRSEGEESGAAPRGRRRARRREVAGAAGLLPFDTFNSPESDKQVGGRRANGPAQATRESSSPRPQPNPASGSASGAGRALRATTEGSR